MDAEAAHAAARQALDERVVHIVLCGEGDRAWWERWICDPPDLDATYTVVRESWADPAPGSEYPVRTIYEIEVIE